MEEHHGIEDHVGGHRRHSHHAASVRRAVSGGVSGSVRAPEHGARGRGERGQGRGDRRRAAQPRRRCGAAAQGYRRRSGLALRVGRRGAEGPRGRRVLHDVHDSGRLLREHRLGRRLRTREGPVEDRLQPEREHVGVPDRRDGVEGSAHAGERHGGRRVLDDRARARGRFGQGHPEGRRRCGRFEERPDHRT